MDSSAEDIYLQKIEEFVHDEDRIITGSILSQDLQVSILTAKHLLTKYVEDQRQIKPDILSVTYLLSGKLKEEGYAVYLVKENELKEKFSLFKNVSEQFIYSVQKSKNVDLSIIANAQHLDPTDLRTTCLKGSIVSNNCIRRQLKVKKLPPPQPQKIVDKQKQTVLSLFKFQAKKETVNSNALEVSPKKSLESFKEPIKKVGGITNFFNKVPVKKETVSPIRKEVNGKKETLEKSVEMIEKKEADTKVTKPDSEKENKDKNSAEVANSSKKKSSTPALKKKKSKKENSSETSGKKRKRIVEASDSDSDDIFASSKEETMEIDQSDEEVKEKSASVKELPPVPRNKRRKAVDKTYEDEEGFIVTRTEYILETDSEEEVKKEVTPPKEEKKALTKTKSVSEISSKPSENKSKTKKGAVSASQPTLMSFFKKK